MGALRIATANFVGLSVAEFVVDLIIITPIILALDSPSDHAQRARVFGPQFRIPTTVPRGLEYRKWVFTIILGKERSYGKWTSVVAVPRATFNLGTLLAKTTDVSVRWIQGQTTVHVE